MMESILEDVQEMAGHSTQCSDPVDKSVKSKIGLHDLRGLFQHYVSVILFQMEEYGCSNAIGRTGKGEKMNFEKVMR